MPDNYLREHNFRLLFELNHRNDLPDQYRILEEIYLDEERGLTSMRLLEILPPEPAS